jgi:ribose transport system permease protein
MLAVYVLATGVQGLQFVTGVLWLNDMFNGTALIAAVSFAVWRQGRAAKGPRDHGADTRRRPSVSDPEPEPLPASSSA